eukprot:m.284330 g.284330  ORF g.284330 m.284330 type:complete len:171 (+) comp19423_c0_seq7:122-634(+)
MVSVGPRACVKTVFRFDQQSGFVLVIPSFSGRNLLIFWLGSVDVNLASNSDRIKYKQEYEEHKLIYTYCIMTVAVLSMLLNFYLGKPFRLVDSLFHVMLVCFYGSITLREHIMIANGSNIRGWWLTHHHIAIFLSWTMMVWPSGFTYVEFHFQFMVFSVFLGESSNRGIV